MKQKLLRSLAVLLCSLTLLCAVPVYAIPTSGNVASGTTVYTGANDSQVLGTIPTFGRVQILGQEGNFYQISAGGITGYVLMSAITPDSTSSTTTTTTNTTTTQTVSGATAGYITNCDSNVNMRASASKSSDKVGTVNKGETVSIIQTDGDYTKITTAAGVTGYVLSTYVASGTPSAGGASSAGSASADTVMLEKGMPMVSISKTIYMRKTTDTSTKSKNLVKKISSAKGKVFTILGSVGSEQFYATYDNYTGYVKATDFAAVSASAAAVSYATGDKSKDKWGEVVKIDGTNIGSAYGKLYDNNIYCNGMNSKGSDFYYNAYSGKKNYFYMFSPQNAGVHVLMSHNMQSSKTGGHYLHHVQNAWLGKSKCEKGCSIDPAAKTSTFYITYANHTQWQLVAFFEGSAAMRNTFAQNYGATGAQKASLISQFLGYSTGTYKGAVVGSAAETDDIMVFITCGDKGSKGGTFLCMLLKGA